jgi:hypothetical protein
MAIVREGSSRSDGTKLKTPRDGTDRKPRISWARDSVGQSDARLSVCRHFGGANPVKASAEGIRAL